MKTIGIVANCSKPQAFAALSKLGEILTRKGIAMAVTSPQEAALLPQASLVAPAEWASIVEAVIALGGDGTVLRAARLVGRSARPILGVNLGALGFLATVSESDLATAIEAVLEGRFRTSKRAALDCRVLEDSQVSMQCRALNDVVLGWGESSRLITLDLEINGKAVTSYSCDGLIVSTPTGSTAHSLSAGGPILHPEADCVVITAICPHTLSHRPLVVPSSVVTQIRIRRSGKKVLLSVDGQETRALDEGAVVEVGVSPDPVAFMELESYDYFDVLRRKLGWRGSSVEGHS